MANDIETRALRLIEREDRINEQRAECERREAERSRLEDARRRIKQHDREIAAEQARQEAAAEAEELAHELHDLGTRLQEHGEGMRSLIEDYAELRGRLQAAERRAGHSISGRWARTSSVLVPWFRSTFGGSDSLVGVPSEQAGQVMVPNREVRTLTGRDPLARP